MMKIKNKAVIISVVFLCLISFSSFAKMNVIYSFEAPDGYYYHYGIYDSDDKENGMEINGKKYPLSKEFTPLSDKSKFVLGFSDKNDLLGDFYTVKPYTVTKDNKVIYNDEIEVKNYNEYPEVNMPYKSAFLVERPDGEFKMTDVTENEFFSGGSLMGLSNNALLSNYGRIGLMRFDISNLKGVDRYNSIKLEFYISQYSNAVGCSPDILVCEVTDENEALPRRDETKELGRISFTPSKHNYYNPMKAEIDVTEYMRKRAKENSETATFAFVLKNRDLSNKENPGAHIYLGSSKALSNNRGCRLKYQEKINYIDNPKEDFIESVTNVIINNKIIYYSKYPYRVNNKYMAEYKRTFEALGFYCYFDRNTDTVTIENNDIVIKTKVGSNLLSVNNKNYNITPFIYDKEEDIILMPLEEISKILNCSFKEKDGNIYIEGGYGI